MSTPPRPVAAGRHLLAFDAGPLVMAILNVTPDSFSDGGLSAQADAALANARWLAAEGAHIIDVGGESTRPGYTPVPAEDEWARIGPVLERLAAEVPLPISVDTMKSRVAARALAAGAVIVNDIWGFSRDPDMARVVADWDAAAVLMHNRTEIDPACDILADMRAFFERALETAAAAGVARERLVLDPGIGFGKSFAQNLLALRRLDVLTAFGLPVLVGASRKSFIVKIVPSSPAERLPGTLAAHLLAVRSGAAILRVHDVAAHVQALAVSEAIGHAR